MKKKFIILFLGLLLPACVFVFLKMFGRNKFDVPPLHADSVQNVPGDCRVTYKAPYALNDSTMRLIGAGKTPVTVLGFGPVYPKLREIVAAYRTEVTLVSYQTDLLSESEYVKRCIILLPEGHDLVLLDNKGQIRGYYNGEDRDELDRLEAETKIILNKY